MNVEVMTGLTEPQVDALIAQVALEVPMLSPTKPFRPGLATSVLIVLIILRKNWTQDETAAVFGCCQATIHRRWELLLQPITHALQSLVPDPADAVRGDTVVVDGTLAPTSDWQHRDDLFSGKHMRPGYNLQIACLLDGTLIGIGRPVPGCHHDTYAWRDSGLREALTGVELLGDLGYEHEPGFTTGVKRLPHQPLSRTDYDRNRGIASIRVVVEKPSPTSKPGASSATPTAAHSTPTPTSSTQSEHFTSTDSAATHSPEKNEAPEALPHVEPSPTSLGSTPRRGTPRHRFSGRGF